MSIVWRKIWRDLAHNKLRTLLVVLSTAVGVFALGLVFGLSDRMRSRMAADYQTTSPAHVTFRGGQYTRESLEVILQEPGVADAEREIRTSFRWKLEGETEWREGDLVARSDYDVQRMNRIELVSGRWPAERALTLERQSSRYFGLSTGNSVVVELGRREMRLPVEGVVRVLTVFPPQFGGNATFYATPETLAWLTDLEVYNYLNLRLPSFSEVAANEVAGQVEGRLERMELPTGVYTINDPGVHPLQNMVDTLSLILAVLGALSLGLSAFLIINTVNAIIAQQVWQIGVMKVVGATFGRVMRLYLTMVLIYGLLAVFIAVPLGAIGAHGMASWLLDMINIANGPFQVVPTAVALQVVVGMTVPLFAALVPIIGGARITPHQAISSYGLGGGFGRGWLDRLIGRIRRLPRPLTLSLRNTFRRKARVALTLLALMIGGAMFIVVMSVSDSFNTTLEVMLGEFGMDVWAVFNRPERQARLIKVTESLPGVVMTEIWDQRAATLALTGGEEREIALFGLPPESELFDPQIVSGRRLLAQDGNAILINNKIAREEGIGVGDEVTLTINERESVWTVVGLVLSVAENQRGCFVPLDMLARETGDVKRGQVVMVLSEHDDVAGQQALIRDLRDLYLSRGLKPAFFLSTSELREQNRTQFGLITSLMLAMALLAAVVGGFGLMGTMSINVVERRREIGVMRAIGGTPAAVVGIFVSEGMLLGLLSWIFVLPISYPGAQIFSQVVGQELLDVPLYFSYSLDGMVYWLAIVLGVSALASLWPASRAMRISVHEALAYE